jgi:crotonobetainyl-CoA:carnitine CoA-transferase CaiB-like acyl-CoA transferase
MQVLDNLSVIEWTEALAGPYCAMLLGDLGANVIKVERPKVGDQSRGWGPPFAGSESAYFLSTNRNKRSLTLNLNHPRGQEIMRKLLARADVFIANQPVRDSLLKRGLDYESLASLNSRLVYCSITGYGWTGPKTGRPGYDIIAQGEAGVMSLTGEPDGEPMRYPIAIADVTCGMFSALGILGALLARERSGKGQFLDMSLFDSQLNWLANIGSSYLNAGETPQRWGNAHPSIVPYEVFHGSDNRRFIVAVGSELLWARFCNVLGIEETIGRDPRFSNNRLRTENRAKLIPGLQEILEARSSEEWLDRFREAEIPAGRINSVDEAFNDPQTVARQLIVEIEHRLLGVARSIANPVKMSATPPTYRLPPPLLGEHTSAILEELGLTGDETRAAQAEGAV